MSDYKFEINVCDVMPKQRSQLKAFRLKRSKWLDRLNGPSVNSIGNQIINLLWYSSLFNVFNESRKNDSSPINAALWDMLFKGYVVQMGTAIRRLVDKNENTCSLAVILMDMQKNQHLLTRENFICYDGWSFDPKPAKEYYQKNNLFDGEAHAIPMEGSGAWYRSEIAHKTFNKVTDSEGSINREDQIDTAVIERLIAELKKPEIDRVKAWVDKQIAHSDHSFDPNDPQFQPTLNDIDESIKTIIQVRQFLSTFILFDTDYGGVPTPQFDVFENLDQPFISFNEMTNLDTYWHKRVKDVDGWASADSGYENAFLIDSA